MNPDHMPRPHNPPHSGPSAAKANGESPAYPWGEHGTVLGGLTKRELFAAMAMQGLAASDGFFKDEALKATAKHLGIAGPSTVAVILAKTSVEFADALLSSLENPA